MKHSELGDCPKCARIDRDFAKEVPPPIAKFDKGDLVEARVQWRIGEDNPFRMADWETELLYPMTVVERAKPELELPTAPGTVIAIGDWHLARLRPYTPNVAAAWEFLPVPEGVQPSVKYSGQKDQCVYSNEWVRAEAEREGGFTIVSEPVADATEKIINRVRELLEPGSMGTWSYAHIMATLNIVEIENGVK